MLSSSSLVSATEEVVSSMPSVSSSFSSVESPRSTSAFDSAGEISRAMRDLELEEDRPAWWFLLDRLREAKSRVAATRDP